MLSWNSRKNNAEDEIENGRKIHKKYGMKGDINNYGSFIHIVKITFDKNITVKVFKLVGFFINIEVFYKEHSSGRKKKNPCC